MANLTGFDASTKGDMLDFDAFPECKALGMMVASQMKPTKDGTGQYLECEFSVLDGPHKGRRLWTRLNLVNKNKQAVDIAERELAAICKAVGKPRPSDSNELHSIPLLLDIGYEPAKAADPVKNKPARKAENYFKGYHPASAAAQVSAAATTAPVPQAPAAPAPRPSTPPWAK